jgi:large conductance mechanosensitive channel
LKSYPLSIDDAKKSEQNDEILLVKKTLAQEFFDFLKTFGIIGLALAFVVGQAAWASNFISK